MRLNRYNFILENQIITLFKKHHIESLSFIDVGAKDQLDYLDTLASVTTMVGFEPNPVELDFLKEKYSKNNFKSLALIGNCLSDYDGKTSFNITKHSSMSSLLDTDLGNYEKHFGLYKNFKNWKSNIEIENKITTAAVRLDSFVKDKNETIDYLKIDTQGSELKILHGAEQLLDEKRINILKVEVSTIAVYQDQVLFSDIDIFLRDKGYVLVDFITYRDNYVPVTGTIHDKNCHYAPCGDAIYVLDSEFLTNKNKIKSGFLLLWLGYYSLGSYLINNSGLPTAEQNVLINHSFTPLRKKIKQLFINLCPPIVLHWLKK